MPARCLIRACPGATLEPGDHRPNFALTVLRREQSHCAGATVRAALEVDSTAELPVKARFQVTGPGPLRPGASKLHTADQSERSETVVQVTLNARTMKGKLPEGLGIQLSDPAHLAFPASVNFDLTGSDLHPGASSLTVRVKGDGWFSWDSLDLVNGP
jgi:hypothetical protein